MAIGRVNAPLGDYFVGDTIKPEHIKIELDGNLDMPRQDYNEYTKRREYSDGLVVGKDNCIYMFVYDFNNYIFKFDKKLNLIWERKVEDTLREYGADLYYNYHKNIMYLHQKKQIIVIDMNADVLKTIEHEGPFTWDDKGNTYLMSLSDKILTVQKLNNSFNKEWAEDYLYSDNLSMSDIFYFHDGYIYIPNKKINVSNRKMEESFSFYSATTNDKQNVVCININYRKSKVLSNDIDYEFQTSTPQSNTYVSDKGEVTWLDGSALFKVAEPGILVNIESLARRDREIYNIAGNNDVIYVAGAEQFSSSTVDDYGFISSYKTSKVKNITITGRD